MNIDIYKEITNVRYNNLCSHEEAIKKIKAENPEMTIFPSLEDNELLIDFIERIKNSLNDGEVKSFDVFLDNWDVFPSATLSIDKDLKLTNYALDKFKDCLFLRIVDVVFRSDNYGDVYIDSVELDTEEEYEKRFRSINDFLIAAAGYIPDDEYEKLFNRSENNEVKEEDIIDIVKNRYNVSLDADFAGHFYEEISNAIKNDRTIDEFNKLIENLSK